MSAGRASLAARLLRALVRGYQLFFSAWIGGDCRFTPSCSAYAMEALERHGALRGSALAGGRLLRCHPGCAGGHDPVPAQAPPLFRTCSADARPSAARAPYEHSSPETSP